mmetsp:Transcript_135532/g.433565  ORF Transcript_135532/g.433565 Transcript_135532/m.433565 type:complete len:209 (-) Transcript_135532:511-1137(-)
MVRPGDTTAACLHLAQLPRGLLQEPGIPHDTTSAEPAMQHNRALTCVGLPGCEDVRRTRRGALGHRRRHLSPGGTRDRATGKSSHHLRGVRGMCWALVLQLKQPSIAEQLIPGAGPAEHEHRRALASHTAGASGQALQQPSGHRRRGVVAPRGGPRRGPEEKKIPLHEACRHPRRRGQIGFVTGLATTRTAPTVDHQEPATQEAERKT